ncbi:MAG: MATE family efflux transporter [Saccharofermentans sp.]|nr:MATE family efflux transporter [Saccharofermentans sp.]
MITNEKKTRKTSTDLTHGDPLKVTLMFALPLFLSNIFQQLYNLTDISIIGHALGDDALSAIGSVSIICGFFNSFLFGMGSGLSVVIAKHFGAGDPKKLKRAVANTIFIAAIWGVVVTLLGIFLLKPLMRLLNTPASIFDMAYGYASIILSMLIFSFTYNVLSGMLRAIGNSKAPLYFLIISVTINIALDLLFVYKLHMGLKGAARATIISQAICVTVCFIYILKYVPELHITRADMVLSRNTILELFSSGIAFTLMYTVVNFGTLILQGAINSFGEVTIAAHTTARKISELCMMMLSTLANAMATFSGQNHGAGRYDRIKLGLRKMLMFSFGIATLLIIMIYSIGGILVRFVSGSETVELINTAMFYLRVDLPFYYVLAVILITRTTLQGMGAKVVPIAASIMELAIKAVTAGYLARVLGYTGIAICEPISWAVCAVYILIVFSIKIKSLDQTRQIRAS